MNKMSDIEKIDFSQLIDTAASIFEGLIETTAAKKFLEKGDFLSRLREASLSRCERWHGPAGVSDWEPVRWSNAMCGEAGEVANAIKKLDRHDQSMQQNDMKGLTRDELVQKVATEIGDVAVYLDLLAARLGLSFEDCIRDTFNRISEREGFPERL